MHRYRIDNTPDMSGKLRGMIGSIKTGEWCKYSDFEKLLKDCNSVLMVQGFNGNWDMNEYMRGMFNGMEFIVSILEEREPKYKDSPVDLKETEEA